jgi:hypothetical protein
MARASLEDVLRWQAVADRISRVYRELYPSLRREIDRATDNALAHALAWHRPLDDPPFDEYLLAAIRVHVTSAITYALASS